MERGKRFPYQYVDATSNSNLSLAERDNNTGQKGYSRSVSDAEHKRKQGKKLTKVIEPVMIMKNFQGRIVEWM